MGLLEVAARWSSDSKEQRGNIFSNDEWNSDVVGELKVKAGKQSTPRERAAGLVIGSGAAVYLPVIFPVSQLFVVDILHPPVEGTLWRARDAMQGDYSDWDGYDQQVLNNIRSPVFRGHYRDERDVAAKSGLRGDYAATRKALANLTMKGVVGNFLSARWTIGKELDAGRMALTFLNLTNLAEVLPAADGANVRTVRWGLGCQISEALPLDEHAVIIDSSRDEGPYSGPTVPKAYSLSEYMGGR